MNKWIEFFGFSIAITALLMMTHALIGITVHGKFIVTAPFGEAPFEIALNIVAIIILISIWIDRWRNASK